MQKELIVAEIGMPQLITGIILLIGLAICWKYLKQALYDVKLNHHSADDYPDLPDHWLD